MNRHFTGQCARCRRMFSRPTAGSLARSRFCSRRCKDASLVRPVAERFWEKVDRSADGCWEWLAGRGTRGYGRLYIDGRGIPANRVSWILAHGPIPDGLEVCHRCDNPPCVNPAHLFLGTHADNMRDMVAKGRRRDRRGETHPAAKLTEAQVKAIRVDPRTQMEIAAAYGIHQGNVSGIKLGTRWRHVV